MRSVAICIFGLALVACGDDAPAQTVDAGPPLDAFIAPGFSAELAIGATSGTIQNPWNATAHGNVEMFGAVEIAGATGTLGGTTAFVYERQLFGEYTLYQGFAVDAARWDIFWIYCQAGGIPGIYDQSVGRHPLLYRAGSGTCSVVDAPTTRAVTLPATTLPVPQPVGGFTVDGPDIHLDRGYGTLRVGGVALPTIVMGIVDCTTTCGSPGWSELHVIAWDAANARAIFAIMYLTAGDNASVLVTYARSLPDLADPIGELALIATWSGSSRDAFVPPIGAPRFGMPPRR